MSSIQSFTQSVSKDNYSSFVSSADSVVTMPYEENFARITTTNTNGGNIYFDTAAMKNALFPNSIAHPVKMNIHSKHRRTGLVQGIAHLRYRVNNVDLGIDWTSNTKYSDNEQSIDITTSTITSMTKNTSIAANGYATYYGVDFRWVIFTLYFTRYDFSATAGTGITAATVSSSTGYDGDTIQYRCTLASGAEWDGWYLNDTLYSSTKDLNVTVNNTDLTLEARCKASSAPNKSFSTLYGNSIIINQEQNNNVQIDYNNTLSVLSETNQINHLLCKNKYMATNLNAGGKTLNCGDKISSYNIPMLYCYGSWDLNQGLQVRTATLAEASGWVTTPFIPVSGKINLTVEAGSTRDNSVLNEYDSAFNYASYWSGELNPRTFTLDTEASYIRCTFLKSALDNCYIYDNTNGKYLFRGGSVE